MCNPCEFMAYPRLRTADQECSVSQSFADVCLSPALFLHFRMNLQLCKLCYQIINFSQTFNLQPTSYSALKIEEGEYFINQPNPGFFVLFCRLCFWLDGPLSISASIIGILINVLSIILMARKRVSKTFHLLMINLSCWDLVS